MRYARGELELGAFGCSMVGNIAVLCGVWGAWGGCKLNKRECGTFMSVYGAGTGCGMGAGRTSGKRKPSCTVIVGPGP
eukprot:1851440-Amphidinium_carterae.1